MKKMYLFAIALICGAIFLTACGGSSSKLTCTGDLKEGENKIGSGEIVAELDGDDKVKNASITMKFDDESYASQMYAFIQLAISFGKQQYEQEGKEFPNLDVKLDGNKIIIDDYASWVKLSDSEDTTNFIGMTKDEFVKYMEQNNEDGTFTCK